MRVLSGIQPSGDLHIGNYFAMMKTMIESQEKSDLYCFIVNLHALTSVFDGQRLAKNTINAAADFLALGLDPQKSTFWIQSDVPEHSELTWILSNSSSMGLLERSHSYKDKVAKGISASVGLFTYPILMAADILLYKPDIVPVGKDQKQHVEIARDIAGSFNHIYGETFVLPKEKINENVALIVGLDGQKMSKSYNNTIEIFIEKDDLKKKVMSIVTDTRGVEEIKDPDNCHLYSLYKLFVDEEKLLELRSRYLAPGLKYSEVKKELIELIWNYFEKARDKRAELLKRPDDIRDIMKSGARKAQKIAAETMEEVRKKIGIIY